MTKKLIIDCWEEGHMVLDWDPKAYKTKAGAAKSLYKALCKWCEDIGMDPKTECHIWTPEQQDDRGYGKYWCVSLEGGPFEWAIRASDVIDNPDWYVEPYYSFNLHFVE